jgi:DNA-directed RNA polymerase specialized sigma24 family protein
VSVSRAEALAYAWQHWERVRDMDNPVGYLYRVGQSRTRRRKVPPLVAPEAVEALPDVDPRLGPALGELSEHQRVAVFLVHGWDWAHAEVGALLDCAPSTVSTHVQRGLARLRELLEVDSRA